MVTPAPIPALVPVLMPAEPSASGWAVSAGEDDDDAAVGGTVIAGTRLLEVLEDELDELADADVDDEVVEVGRNPCCQMTDPPRTVGRAAMLVKVGASVKAAVGAVAVQVHESGFWIVVGFACCVHAVHRFVSLQVARPTHGEPVSQGYIVSIFISVC